MSRRLIVTVLAGCSLAPVAHATNGLFLIGSGNISRGMGGVAIATPVDSLSAAANPASISGMAPRLDVGTDFFMPIAEGTLGSVTSNSKNNGIGIDNLFLMPSMGAVYPGSKLGLGRDFTLGINGVSAGGGGTRYETNFFQAARLGTTDSPAIQDVAGVNLNIMQINSTLAYQLPETRHSVGVSLVLGIARFRAFGIDLFDPFTQNTGTSKDFSDQGNDWSYGAGVRIGWLGDYGALTLGASLSSRVYMSNFSRYEELLAEEGDMDTPPMLGFGMGYQWSPQWRLGMDLTHTFYSQVRSISNSGPNLAGDPSGPLDPETQQLGQKNGLGFGWDDQTVIKLGVEYRKDPKLTFRGGWNYGKSPIDENGQIIFNLLAPAITQHHLTMGTSYQLSSVSAINFSFVHAYQFEQSGPTYVSDDGSNRGSFKMHQNSLGVSYSSNF